MGGVKKNVLQRKGEKEIGRQWKRGKRQKKSRVGQGVGKNDVFYHVREKHIKQGTTFIC